MDAAAGEDVPTRIKLYRGLAAMDSTPEKAREFLINAAEHLEAAQNNHREAAAQFDFQRTLELNPKG